VSHAADGTYAYFAHNEYLQIAADAGAIGLALLLAVAVAVFRAIRRFDVMSSCACATLVCFAVGGAFDYDWHLSFLGFLGGWCAGLAASAHRVEGEQSQEPDRVGHRGRHLGRSDWGPSGKVVRKDPQYARPRMDEVEVGATEAMLPLHAREGS
jgi:hypothetical protein